MKTKSRSGSPRTATKATAKVKTKATPAKQTGAKIDILEGQPIIERQFNIGNGSKIQRFTIWGRNEEELGKAKEQALKLVKDKEKKNRGYMEANVEKFGIDCPSLQTCIFPPFPFVYEGPNEQKRMAWIVRAQADMKDWFDTPSPSRVLSFIAVLGRAEAIKIHLYLHDENLTKETITLSPRDVTEITYTRKHCVTFKTGFKLDLVFCKSERVSMQEINDDTFIQQAFEEHFNNTTEQNKASDIGKYAKRLGISYSPRKAITIGKDVFELNSERQWKVAELLLNSDDPEGWVTLPNGSKDTGLFTGRNESLQNDVYKFYLHIKNKRALNKYRLELEADEPNSPHCKSTKNGV